VNDRPFSDIEEDGMRLGCKIVVNVKRMAIFTVI
jgi:hypothetical protein